MSSLCDYFFDKIVEKFREGLSLSKEDYRRWIFLDVCGFEPAEKLPKEFGLVSDLFTYEKDKPECFGKFQFLLGSLIGEGFRLGCVGRDVDCKYKRACLAFRLEKKRQEFVNKIKRNLGRDYCDYYKALREEALQERPPNFDMEVCIACWSKEKLDVSVFAELWKRNKILCKVESRHFLTLHQSCPTDCPYAFL